jgi:predicted alpha/beta-fold hydrolase
MESPVSNAVPRSPVRFLPRRWLRGAHAQTLAGNFLRRPKRLPPPEERLFEVEPGAQVLCHCHWQSERQKRFTILLVHGLEGSSQSHYVIGTGYKAWQRGWNVVRMNVRNCGGTEKLCSTLYTSGLSADVRAVATALIEQDSLEAIGLAGFSMGGNQVLKCAGEWGASAPREVRAIAAVSPACDLATSADRLHQPRNRIYELWFLHSLFQRFRRKARLFPGQYDVELLRKVHSIRQFDHFITARYMGFQSADDYYTKASAARFLDGISVPALVIHSDDDPFVVVGPETEAKLAANPNIMYLRSEHGGHCAFLAATDGYDGRWAEQQVIEFMADKLKGVSEKAREPHSSQPMA